MTTKNQIRDKNDFLRKSLPNLPLPHKVVFAEGASGHHPVVLYEVIEKIRDFKDFTEEDDPYKEHDFGTVEAGGTEFFWKIDYTDEAYENFKTDGIRIFTIMEASEW
jgi:hypothetical protein